MERLEPSPGVDDPTPILLVVALEGGGGCRLRSRSSINEMLNSWWGSARRPNPMTARAGRVRVLILIRIYVSNSDGHLTMSDLRRWVSRKDKVAYQRLLSGLAYHHDSDIRFLTLTNVPGNIDFIKQTLDFQRLVRWARTKYGHFEYFNVHTAEGNGVFHALLTGNYIPISPMRGKWKEMTGAHQVKIKFVETDVSGMPSSRIFHEMTRQRAVIRYSCSRGWLRRDSIKAWRYYKDWVGQSMLVDGHPYIFRKSSAIRLFELWNSSSEENSDYLDFFYKNATPYYLGVVTPPVSTVVTQ